MARRWGGRADNHEVRLSSLKEGQRNKNFRQLSPQTRDVPGCNVWLQWLENAVSTWCLMLVQSHWLPTTSAFNQRLVSKWNNRKLSLRQRAPDAASFIEIKTLFWRHYDRTGLSFLMMGTSRREENDAAAVLSFQCPTFMTSRSNILQRISFLRV